MLLELEKNLMSGILTKEKTMSATTLPKRQHKHHPSGERLRPRPYALLLIGGVIFAAAWIVWTFWFSPAIPK